MTYVQALQFQSVYELQCPALITFAWEEIDEGGHFLRDKSGFLLPFTAAAQTGYKPIDGNGTVVVFLETTYRTLQVLVLRGKLSSESASPPPPPPRNFFRPPNWKFPPQAGVIPRYVVEI